MDILWGAGCLLTVQVQAHVRGIEMLQPHAVESRAAECCCCTFVCEMMVMKSAVMCLSSAFVVYFIE